MKLHVNGAVRDIDAPEDMPLLWVLRDCSADRHEVRLRHGAVRGLHRPPRREGRRACVTPVSAVGAE